MWSMFAAELYYDIRDLEIARMSSSSIDANGFICQKQFGSLFHYSLGIKFERKRQRDEESKRESERKVKRDILFMYKYQEQVEI